MKHDKTDELIISREGATLDGKELYIGDRVEVPVRSKHGRIWKKGVVSGIESGDRRRIFVVVGDGRLTRKEDTVVLFGDDAAHLPLIRRLQYE